MNIHEYQAKELFDKFNVPSPKGKVASSAEEAKAAAEALGGSNLVVKAQVHAGGRGKGTFKNGFQGGVHLVNSAAEASEIAGKMIGEVLVSNLHKNPVNMCVEVARRHAPSRVRPSFDEIEQALRGLKQAA